MEGYIANEHFYKLSDGPVINTVHFIGSGYQSVMQLYFKGDTTEDVFELAEEWLPRPDRLSNTVMNSSGESGLFLKTPLNGLITNSTNLHRRLER